jgi:hypothetical protein
MGTIQQSTSRLARLVTALAALMLPPLVSAAPLDAPFLEGLRARRLFTLAESYCLDRLTQLPPRDPANVELTVELVRTLAEHAINRAPGERSALWTKAHDAAAQFLRQNPPHPRAMLVRFQDALALLARGELGRQEQEAGTLSAGELEPTRQALRDSAAALGELAKELRTELPLRRRSGPVSGGLSVDELANLAEHVEHQRARAQRNQALLFPAGSDDRLALLLAAAEILERASAQTADDGLRGEILRELAECQRRLGRFDRALELVAALDRDGIPAPIRLRARAERIRIAVAQNDAAAVERTIEAGRTIDSQSTAELDFAWFEGFLYLARASAGKPAGGDAAEPQSPAAAQQAKIYFDRAAETVNFLEETYGAYWGRRASALLAAALPRGAGANAQLLSRAADSLYLKGELDEAIAAYDQAAAQARSQGDLNAAFPLAYKAALIEQQRHHHRAAASRLRILARELPTHAQAAPAHLLAAWNAAQPMGDAQEVRDAPPTGNLPPAADLFAEVLREHVALWPRAESTGQARLWLGNLYETSHKRRDAIAAYGAISRGSEHYAGAMAALARCWREELAIQASGGDAADAAAAIAFFRRAVVGSDNRWPERWTEADRTAALAAAELIDRYEPAGAAEAEALLRRAMAGSTDAPPAWQTAAQTQLVLAMALQPDRRAAARGELERIAAASPEQLLAVVEGLAAAAERGSAAEFAPLELAVVATLNQRRDQLSAANRLALDRAAASALAASNRAGEAAALLARLAKEHPDNGDVQEDYAERLLASADPAQLKAALDQWRRIAARTRPNTPRWFHAKYSVALAQFKTGDRSGAATLLGYVAATSPALASSPWQAKYEELLQKCER